MPHKNTYACRRHRRRRRSCGVAHVGSIIRGCCTPYYVPFPFSPGICWLVGRVGMAVRTLGYFFPRASVLMCIFSDDAAAKENGVVCAFACVCVCVCTFRRHAFRVCVFVWHVVEKEEEEDVHEHARVARVCVQVVLG